MAVAAQLPSEQVIGVEPVQVSALAETNLPSIKIPERKSKQIKTPNK